MEDKPFLNQKQVAARVGFSARTIRRWTECGRFPKPMKDGRSIYWSVKLIETIINSGQLRTTADIDIKRT